MNKLLFAIVATLALFVAGCAQSTTSSDTAMAKDVDAMEKNDVMVSQDVMIKEDTSTSEDSSDAMMVKDESDKMMEKDSDFMMEESNDSMMKSEDTMMSSYEGEVLAGTTTPYLSFTQSDYDAALAANKKIIINFYASWCPNCREEQAQAIAAFNQLQNDNVVGFQVNYKDSNTDAAEEALAKEFGITYQHTKVILENGERVLKSTESWNTATYIAELS